MKIISIHQPAYIPWLGYFDKIAGSDIHIFFDDAQYSKNNLFNRNKIKTPGGAQWLTIPVSYKSTAKICEIKVGAGIDWQENHWKTIRLNYAKAPYFKKYEDIFSIIYSRAWDNLADLNIEFNSKICELLGIKTQFKRSSELKAAGVKNEKLVNLCKAVGADIYLSGQGAKSMEHNPYRQPYLEENIFLNNNIQVNYQEFQYPEYGQLWGEFIPNLSIIDMLFNYGADNIKHCLTKK